MNVRTHLLIGLVITVPLVAALPGQAQSQSSDSKYEHQYSRFDLEFPGGTVNEYVEKIREARPSGAANVVVMPNARQLIVPPVKLSSSRLRTTESYSNGPFRTVRTITSTLPQ